MPQVTPRIINPPFAFADLNTFAVQFQQSSPVLLDDGVETTLVTAMGDPQESQDVIFAVGQAVPQGQGGVANLMQLFIRDITAGGPFIDWFLSGNAVPTCDRLSHNSDPGAMQVFGFGVLNAAASPIVTLSAEISGDDGDVIGGTMFLNLFQFSSQ